MSDLKRVVRNTVKAALLNPDWREDVTDRRQRQRANELRPDGSNCYWCGHPHKLMVAHVDGDESNLHERNLGLTCRSCNSKVAYQMKSAGVGRRTRQYNPKGGAENLGQWMAAVMSMKGESDQMTVRQAVDMIHKTPPEDRSYFALEIWRICQSRGTDDVPF